MMQEWLQGWFPAPAALAAETTVAAETAAESTSGGSHMGMVLLILAIFTITCAVTAYLVMRPSLKKLKDAKKQTASDPEPEDVPEHTTDDTAI